MNKIVFFKYNFGLLFIIVGWWLWTITLRKIYDMVRIIKICEQLKVKNNL